MTLRLPFLLAGPLLVAGAAGAGSQTWPFDVQTTGADVFWTSPTSVDAAAPLYLSGYQITLVEVDVMWIGIPFDNIDVTGEVPPDLLSGSKADPGPAPVTMFAESLLYPAPPDPIAVAVDVTIGLDAAGFAEVAGTNVVLGTATVELPIFGEQQVDITSIRMVGQISVTALTCPWDIDGSGDVGIDDFLAILGSWGTASIGPPDLDGDGVVGIGDFLALLAHWGPCP